MKAPKIKKNKRPGYADGKTSISEMYDLSQLSDAQRLQLGGYNNVQEQIKYLQSQGIKGRAEQDGPGWGQEAPQQNNSLVKQTFDAANQYRDTSAKVTKNSIPQYSPAVQQASVTASTSYNPNLVSQLNADQLAEFNGLDDVAKGEYLKANTSYDNVKAPNGDGGGNGEAQATAGMQIAGAASSAVGSEFTKSAQKGADKYGYIDPNKANAGRFLDYTGKGLSTGASIGGPVGGLIGAIAGTMYAGIGGAAANKKNLQESNKRRLEYNSNFVYDDVAGKKGGAGMTARQETSNDKTAYMGNALMSGGISHFLAQGQQPKSSGLTSKLGGQTGVISGPGTGKSDDIPMNVQPEDMIVPKEHAKEAIALLLKHTDYKQVKAIKGKEAGANAQVSDGEVKISPKHVEQLIAAGVDLNSLAPNSSNSNGAYWGGKLPNQSDANKIKAGKEKAEAEKKAQEELAKKREFVSDEDLNDPNMQAYLYALAKAESGFVDTARNPKSTAEGTFQFLDSTHQNIKKMYGYDGRSADWNESGKASAALIKEKPAALKAIKEGRFDDADSLLKDVWSSLPGGVHPSKHTENYQIYRNNYLSGNHPELDQVKANYLESQKVSPSVMPQPQNPLMSPGKPLRGIVSEFADGKLPTSQRPGYSKGTQSSLLTRKKYTKDEVIKAIVASAYSHGITDKNQIDALIAIASHETGGKFDPYIGEGGTKGANIGDVDNVGNYKNTKYTGRGLVQLTHKENYQKATDYYKSRGIDKDFVSNPDLASADLETAVDLLVVGAKDGWYNGKGIKLADVAEKGPTEIYHLINPGAQKDKVKIFNDHLNLAKDSTKTYFTGSRDPKTHNVQYIIDPKTFDDSGTYTDQKPDDSPLIKSTNNPVPSTNKSSVSKKDDSFEQAKKNYGIAEKKYQEAEAKRKAAGNNVPVSDPLNKDLVAARKERDEALNVLSKRYNDAVAKRKEAGNNVVITDPLNKEVVDAKKELDTIKKEFETNNPYTASDIVKKEEGKVGNSKNERHDLLEKTAPKTFDPYNFDPYKPEEDRQVLNFGPSNGTLLPEYQDENRDIDRSNLPPVQKIEPRKANNLQADLDQKIIESQNKIVEDSKNHELKYNPPTQPPPPPPGKTALMRTYDALGGMGGLMALAQTGFGIYGLATNKQPEDYETDPVIKKMRDDAMLDSERMDPAIKAAAERNFELTRRGQIEQVQQMAGSDTGLAVNAMRRAGIDKNRSIVDLAAMQEGQKLQKKQFAAGLAGQVASMDRKGWEDKNERFVMNQQAAGATMNAGLTNLLGAMNFRQQNEKLDKLGTGATITFNPTIPPATTPPTTTNP